MQLSSNRSPTLATPLHCLHWPICMAVKMKRICHWKMILSLEQLINWLIEFSLSQLGGHLLLSQQFHCRAHNWWSFIGHSDKSLAIHLLLPLLLIGQQQFNSKGIQLISLRMVKARARLWTCRGPSDQHEAAEAVINLHAAQWTPNGLPACQ